MSDTTPSTPRLTECINCKVKPRFIQSDDPELAELLVHDENTCPLRSKMYDTSRAACARYWNDEQNTPQRLRQSC